MLFFRASGSIAQDMFNPQKLTTTLALLLLAIPASAGTAAYIVTGNPDGSGEFGVMTLDTGAFRQIGSGVPGSQGLAFGPNGSLFTLAFSGSLDTINPATGVSTVIGATGLADCSTPPASPCGPHAASSLGAVGGQLYVTDLANNLYRVNPSTGAATLIGPTGIPPLPFNPLSVNPDNTFNAYTQSLFGANGRLYATFDAFTVSSTTFQPVSIVIAPELYQIDPATGAARLIGPTDLTLGGIAAVNGSYYALNDSRAEVSTIDLSTGHTTRVTGFDPSVGIISGAAATPEPASIALTGIGIAAALVWRRRRS